MLLFIAAVNEAFARRYFDGRNPAGQTFQIEPGRIPLQIVAYLRDARYTEMRVPVLATAYVSFGNINAKSPQDSDSATFLVRTKSPNPMVLASILRGEIPRARPEFRVSDILTQQELVDAQTIRERLLAQVFCMLALGAVCGLALGLGSARYIATLLYQVKPTDAPMLAVPAIMILTAALLAALPPVLRATRIDPSEMLRAE